jgi:hypothetical protein
MTEQELIEALADKEHASWARWMAYLFANCLDVGDYDVAGYQSYVIPRELVARWKRQIVTPYTDLSEREKQSDRDEVAHILPIVEEYSSQEALSKGVMTTNEVRSMKGLPTLVTYRGMSMQELDERIDFYRMHRGDK